MFNTVLTIPLNLLLLLLVGVAAVSGAITYTITQFNREPLPVYPAITCSNLYSRTPEQEMARKRYFKVHKAKMNGEGF